MTHILGFERSQLLLLPEAVDDYVDADNPVRFIDAFVDGLDLAVAGFSRVAPKATGRPGYAPADLLKLYIYGYLNRVRSSRRLERRWLDRRAQLRRRRQFGLLSPDTAAAGVDPRRPAVPVVARPPHDGGAAVGGQCDGEALLVVQDTTCQIKS
jgi:hypothetical protein